MGQDFISCVDDEADGVPPSTGTPKVYLSASFDHETYAAAADPLTYCLVEFALTTDEQATLQRTDADLALVLDVSGSMDKPNRYPLLREAVRQLVLGLGPTDRLSITLFSDRAETVVPLVAGADAVEQSGDLIECMDRSSLLFGPKTLLSPGLMLGLEALGPRAPGRVRRVYVLTDGELHDTQASEQVLEGFRAQHAEVHVYGFGDEFNAAALKQLVSDQLGGSVKPICNEDDIVRTFAHLARVNRRLVGQEGRLCVTLPPSIVGGDAWVFRPASRYLGAIQGRRLEHVFGGIEAGRVYSLLLEARLPSDAHAAQTPVASVQASWVQGGASATHTIEAAVQRCSGIPRATSPATASLVTRAFEALNVLRNEEDHQTVLASLRARRELAVLEKRDPNLIAALDKMIASLTEIARGNPARAVAGKVVQAARAQLTPEQELYLDSDDASVTMGP